MHDDDIMVRMQITDDEGTETGFVTLGEFFSDHAFGPAQQARIVETLQAGGTFTCGGGDQPVWEIELAPANDLHG